MNKKISLGAALALIIIAMALTVSVTMGVAMRHFNSNITALGKKQEMFNNLADVDTAVRQQYGNIDEARLRANLAKGYISSIDDPYAAYLSASEYKKAQEIEQGKTTGFGIEVSLLSDSRVVTTLIHKDSAAEKAGMQKGDEITAVDGAAVTQDNFESVKTKLDSATKVMITAKRGDATASYELTASPYDLVSVQERMIGTVGYIRIRGFHLNTTEQFKAAYSALEEEGASAFIFDLRNNEGGTLQSAQEVISYLLPRGKYATLTDNAGQVTDLISEDTHTLGVPSVTLVNAKTAGEAELLAGVLQEMEMTTVVGETTAGKGKVQEFFPLKVDSSAVRLSVAQLSLLQGGPLQDNGVLPTWEIALSEAQQTDFELLDEKTDPQLSLAISVLDGSVNSTPTTAPATASTTTPTTQPTTMQTPST